MDDIISVIDAAVGCQQCGRSLEGSVSDDFCGEGCQQAWHAERVVLAPSAESVATRPASRLHQGVMTLNAATIYRSDGDGRWIEMGTTGPVQIQAHYEIREDGSLVDNMAAVASRPNSNSDIRGCIAPEVWDRLRQGEGS